MSQRLDVVHDRGPAPSASLDQARRAQARLGDAALQVVCQCARFPGHEPVRRCHDVQPHLVGCHGGPLSGGGGHRCDNSWVDDHEGLSGPDGSGNEHCPVQHEVRGKEEQDLVLLARRFALGAVGDNDRPVPANLDRVQFPRSGEPGAAAADEPRALDRGQ